MGYKITSQFNCAEHIQQRPIALFFTKFLKSYHDH